MSAKSSASIYDGLRPYDLPSTPVSEKPTVDETPKPKAGKANGRIMKKLVSTCKTLKSVASVIKTANAVVKMLKVMELVAKPILKVLPFVGVFTYVIGVLPSSGMEVVKSGKRVRTFTNLSNKLRECSDVEGKAKILRKKIDLIQAERNSLEKDLGLSKEACDTIQARIDRVRALQFTEGKAVTIEQAQVVDEMEGAIDILKGRARVMLAYDSLDLVTNIVELASQILFMTPLVVAGAALGLACISSSVGAPLAKSYCINSNPFDPASKSKALRAVDRVRTGFRHVCETLDFRNWSRRSSMSSCVVVA